MNSLNEKWMGEIHQLLSSLNSSQIIYLRGYLAGLSFSMTDAQSDALGASHCSEPAVEPIKILFGSQSGNAARMANAVFLLAQQRKITSELQSLADFNVREIKDISSLILVVSTHGDGAPPLAAEELYSYLKKLKGKELNSLRFSVLALGDSTYEKFCQTGIDFHHFLVNGGARPLHDPILLDVDFESQLSQVIPGVLDFWTTGITEKSKKDIHVPAPFAMGNVSAGVSEKIMLNGRGSDKETWHIELDIGNSGLSYEPGDSLEIFASNHPDLVQKVISQINALPEDQVLVGEDYMSLHEALVHHYELTVVSHSVLKKYADLANSVQLNDILADPLKQEPILKGTDVLDLLQKFPVKITPDELLKVLRRMPPRLYSISSSPLMHENEVHLTVGAVRFEKDQRDREGVCSTFLADRLDVDEVAKVRVRPNFQFRLPQNLKSDVIMIAAGTGIAPFRAFVQHRKALKAQGRNWLFFGDRHFKTDFLYQTEWLKYRNEGILTRLDVAFSRDQSHKVYVQNRLAENSAELFLWLTQGAHVYVCGNKNSLAKDVRSALTGILCQEAKLSDDEAACFLEDLRKNGRYQEDVY